MNINDLISQSRTIAESRTVTDEIQDEFQEFCNPVIEKPKHKVVVENLKIDNSAMHCELNDFNKKSTLDSVIKEMYDQNPNIFNKDFNLVHETAVYINNVLNKEVYTESEVKVFINEFITEDGRIVKNVNTTNDVGMDEIAIQAKKMGFTVTTGGVPAYLTPNGAHPKPVVVESQLTELKMGPKHLSKEVQKLLKVVTPIVGVELEVCKQPNEEVDNQRDLVVTDRLDYNEFSEFFNTTDEEFIDQKIGKAWAKWIQKKRPDASDLPWEKITRNNGAEWYEDPNDMSFGSFMIANGYHSAMDLYYDNQDWMEEPESEYNDTNYSIQEAEQTVEEMGDYGIKAEAEKEYHSGNRPEDKWVIEPDDSIKPNPGDIGLEIISPPMEYEDGIIQLEDMLNMLQNGGYYTNDSTGLHINVSIEGMGFSGLDYTKLVLLAGDSHVLQQFGREMNNYTSNAVEGLSQYFKGHSSLIYKVFDTMRDGIGNLGAEFIGNINLGGQVSVEIKHGYIEFRSAGGQDYIHNSETIINTINRFIVAYAAAMSPELHRKEYAKKLYKLISQHLPGGANRNIQHAMQLFSMNQAGMFDRNRLKEKLKDLQGARKVEREWSPEGLLAEKILKINPTMTNSQVLTIIRKGMEIEKKIVPPDQITKTVHANLMKSLDFYLNMDRDDIKNYIENPEAWN